MVFFSTCGSSCCAFFFFSSRRRHTRFSRDWSSDVCSSDLDRPATVEQIWGQPAIAELRHRLTLADAPHEMLMLLEEELVRRLRVIDGLDLVRQMSSAVAATGGTVPISDIGV